MAGRPKERKKDPTKAEFDEDAGGKSLNEAACYEHEYRSAEYRCDACRRMLCEECIEIGNRLLFCRACGELALPLVETDARDALGLSRQRAVRAPYTLRKAFGYPFRGAGSYVFWSRSTLCTLGGATLIEALVPIVGLPFLVVRIVIAVLLPGLLFAIVRSTARGDSELPGWPDWMEGDRLWELFSAVVLGFFALLPAISLLRLMGCGVSGLFNGGVVCWLASLLGLGIGLLIAVPGLAGAAAFGPGPVSLRIDLHVRALLAARAVSARVALIALTLTVTAVLVELMLSSSPLLSGLSALASNLYTLFVSAHLIGLLLRWHERDLEPIYCQ